MRIRKRQVPFPLLPVTLSDPNLINRSPVLVQLNDASTTSPKPSCTHASATAPLSFLDPPQPSDQPLPPIGKPTNGPDDSFAHRRQDKKQGCLVEGEGQKGNDTRKGSILSSEMPSEVISPSSSTLNSKQDGRWCEGEKAFPFKKRRGNFENVAIEDSISINHNNDNGNKKKMKKTKRRLKTKMNKKCLGQGDSNNELDEEGVVVMRETKPDHVNGGKKRVRGGALMEGSRCSRVNGRGWRCCQQTLVGYSLCEHHLGKGRLRSMTSVRSRSIAAPKNNNNMQEQTLSELPSSSTSSLPEKQTKCVTHLNDGEDNDEKKPVMVTKKRMKLGMVKARSISSLLGQTNNTTEIALVAENNNK